MSSRKSSRRNSISNSSKDNNSKTEKNIQVEKKAFNAYQLITFMISVIVQCSILYYLYNLEDADCNCIRDWRHNFCKAYSLLVLCVSILIIGLGLHNLTRWFIILYGIFGLINAYAFFTYIGDLNSTQCICAVKKQYNLNTIMQIYRWVILIGVIFLFLKLVGMAFIIAKISTSK